MKTNHYTMKVRNSLRKALEGLPDGSPIGVGVSGGADSLALLLGLTTLYKGDKARLVHVVTVDHGLQPVTAQVSERVAALAESYGFHSHVERIVVDMNRNSLEDAARDARYEAFRKNIEEYNLGAFLIAHTKNDQAEQVLLGLLRGSGTKSVSGMPNSRDVFIRPLLTSVSRGETKKVCVENNVEFWSDPENDSDDYSRVVIRKLLHEISTKTGQDLIDPLVRTASIAKDDNDALEFYADNLYQSAQTADWSVDVLMTAPKAVRSRVLKKKILSLHVPSENVTWEILQRVESLLSDWRGQGEVTLACGHSVSRKNNRIIFI